KGRVAMRLPRRLAYCLAALALCAVVGCPRPQLVLYCAQDKEFAEGILASFKKETGVEVTPKFDTEADKSVSLYQEIVREQGRPQFGTSATQAACLFQALGKEKAEKYYLDLKKNDIHLAPGNKQVADWVADGKTPTGERVVVGVTDTDDAMEAIKAKKKVALI